MLNMYAWVVSDPSHEIVAGIIFTGGPFGIYAMYAAGFLSWQLITCYIAGLEAGSVDTSDLRATLTTAKTHEQNNDFCVSVIYSIDPAGDATVSGFSVPAFLEQSVLFGLSFIGIPTATEDWIRDIILAVLY